MRVRATHTLTLGPGTVLTLSGRQATARAHALEHLGGDRYRTRVAVEFKAGEELDIDGDVPKALYALVDTDEKPAHVKKSAVRRAAGAAAAPAPTLPDTAPAAQPCD